MKISSFPLKTPWHKNGTSFKGDSAPYNAHIERTNRSSNANIRPEPCFRLNQDVYAHRHKNPRCEETCHLHSDFLGDMIAQDPDFEIKILEKLAQKSSPDKDETINDICVKILKEKPNIDEKDFDKALLLMAAKKIRQTGPYLFMTPKNAIKFVRNETDIRKEFSSALIPDIINEMEM